MSIYDTLRSDVAQAETLYNQALSDIAAKDQQISDLEAQVAELSKPTQPAPTPPTSTNVVGAAWKSGESLPSVVTHLDVYRYYFPPGKMKTAQSWGGDEKVAHDKYGCRVFSVSFKPDSLSANPPFAAASITNLKNYLSSIPADVPRENVLVTFFHEHNGDLRDGTYTLDLYKKGSKQVADVAHSLGMRYGPIHNGVNRKGNTATGAWGLWPDAWQVCEADTSLYDFWGADCYSNKYENPSPYMDPLPAYAKSLGKPLLLGEIGAPADAGNLQEQWCAKARTWSLQNSRWTMYWSSQVSASTTDYRLSDASAKAWFGI